MNVIYLLLSNCIDIKYLISFQKNKENVKNELDIKYNNINNLSNNNIVNIYKNNKEYKNDIDINIICKECKNNISNYKTIYCLYDNIFCSYNCRKKYNK